MDVHPLTIYLISQLDMAERLAQAETERQVLRIRRARRAARRAARTATRVPAVLPEPASDAGARHRLLAGLATRAAGERTAGARARETFGAPAADVLPDGTIGCRA